jgi:hypothetical protein
MPKLAYITFHGKGIMVSAVTLMKNVQRSWLVSNLGYLHYSFDYFPVFGCTDTLTLHTRCSWGVICSTRYKL